MPAARTQNQLSTAFRPCQPGCPALDAMSSVRTAEGQTSARTAHHTANPSARRATAGASLGASPPAARRVALHTYQSTSCSLTPSHIQRQTRDLALPIVRRIVLAAVRQAAALVTSGMTSSTMVDISSSVSLAGLPPAHGCHASIQNLGFPRLPPAIRHSPAQRSTSPESGCVCPQLQAPFSLVAFSHAPPARILTPACRHLQSSCLQSAIVSW